MIPNSALVPSALTAALITPCAIVLYAVSWMKKLRAEGKVASAETVVLMLTGHTLKDADYTINFHRGKLLAIDEAEGREAEIASLRRDAVAVEATPAAVLDALKGSSR